MLPDPAAWDACRFREERFRLESGLAAHLVTRPYRPIVSATLLLPAGVVGERPDEAGLAALTAGLVTMGTQRHSAAEWAEEVDGRGASFGVAADYDFTIASVGCLARDFPEMLDLLAETVLRPAFLEEEFQRRRAETLDQLVRRRDDAGAQVRNRFAERLYAPHPYSHPLEGRAQDLERFQLASVRRYHAQHYRPDGAILAVVGDINRGRFEAAMQHSFGGWTGEPAAAIELPPLGACEGGSERIQKDGRVQALLRVGHRAPARSDPDHLAGLLANFILGAGGPGSRLMRRLREERGIVYDVRSSLLGRRHAGSFFAAARTSRETMDEALDALRREIFLLHAEGVTDEELTRAQRFFTGSLPLAFETNDQVATLLLTREFYQLEEEYWRRDLETIMEIDRTAILEAVRRLLRPDDLTTICLTDFRPPPESPTQEV